MDMCSDKSSSIVGTFVLMITSKSDLFNTRLFECEVLHKSAVLHASAVADTSGASGRPGRHFRWSGALAKHTYISKSEKYSALVEVHVMVKLRFFEETNTYRVAQK